MNPLFEKGFTRQVPSLVRLTAAVVLCALGCLCSILWVITNNHVLGLIGLLCGIPCIAMGVALFLGRVRQTKLSSNGIRFFGVIVFIAGLVGIYNHQPYASLLIVCAISFCKIANQMSRAKGI